MDSIPMLLNANNRSEQSPLSHAAQAGDIHAVKLLLADSRVDVNARDFKGRTPLLLAAQNGQTDVVSQLLERGATPNWQDLKRATPLWYAAERGHVDTVRLLLSSGRLSDMNPKPTIDEYVENTPLSIALRKGYCEIAELLARADDVDPHIQLELGRLDGTISPLGLAVRNGYEDVALALLNKYGIGEGSRDAESSFEILVLAAGAGSLRLVETLLSKYRVDPNMIYPYGKEYKFSGHTPLMAAAKAGHAAIVRLLLDTDGIHPDIRSTSQGISALSLAAEEGFRDVVKMLVADSRVDADQRNSEGRTPLSLAASRACEAVVEELLLMPEKVNPDSRDGKNRTPLSWAVSPKYSYGPNGWPTYEGVVRRLLGSGRVNPNSMDHMGDTPLIHASGRGAIGLVKAILEHPNTDPNYGDNRTPLAVAAKEGHADVVKALLETGQVDLNATNTLDYSERTALSHAAGGGHQEVVELLLSKPRIEPNKRDGNGGTPLAAAANEGRTAIVERLLALEGTDPNSRNNKGRTPLSATATAASWSDTADAMKLLLAANGVDPDPADIDGRTPLSLAAESGRGELVDILLATDGVNPDSRDTSGRSPLSWVIAPERWEGGYSYKRIDRQKTIVRQLLRNQAVDPNSEDRDGLTPLIRAIKGTNGSEFVELLLERNDLDINKKSRDGRTPMTIAREHGDTATILLLRERGALGEEANPANGESQRDSSNELNGDTGAMEPTDTETPQAEQGFVSAQYNGRKRRRRRRQSSRSSTRSPTYEFYGARDVGESTKIRLRHELSREIHLPLGTQVEYLDTVEGNEADLCPKCEGINLDEAFSNRKTHYGGYVVAKLGKVDETWETRKCSMCRLIAAVRPQHYAIDTSKATRIGSATVDNNDNEDDDGDNQYKLLAFSSTGSWLCHDMLISWDQFQGSWIDTMVLGVVAVRRLGDSQSHHSTVNSVLASGFIGRLGSNCPYGTQAITVPQVHSSKIDMDAAKGWITRCAEDHGRRCNPRRLVPVPHFHLIECSTGTIIKIVGSVPSYVALSYVWGSPPAAIPLEQIKRDGQNDDTHIQASIETKLGVVERVVEDAIRVTLELGYKYLWVDRYCIAQKGDAKVKQEQLRSMHLVYMNAEVTLVAAAGQDSSFGLPGVSSQRPRHAQLCARVKGHALTCIPPDPAEGIRSSTWAERGWTYQEGLLARRRLFFSEHEMSYECRELLCREAIRLPLDAEHKVCGNDRRLMAPSWIYKPYGFSSSSRGGSDLFELLGQYTVRHLTYQSDALNAMLGILQVFGERKRNPIYHLCGVPVLRIKESKLPEFRKRRSRRRPRASSSISDGESDTTDAAAVSLALVGFVNGLCWKLRRPSERRPGFPSWSWVGWQGVADSLYGKSPGLLFDYGFDVDVSVVIKDGTEVVLWDDYYRRLKETGHREAVSEFYFSQHHILEITADVVTARFHREYRSYYDGYRWKGTVCVGNGVWDGDFSLTRKDSPSSSQAAKPDEEVDIAALGLQHRLLEEPWLGIVLGNTYPPHRKDNYTYVLIVGEQQQLGTAGCMYWERVGLLQLSESNLERGMLERRTLRLA